MNSGTKSKKRNNNKSNSVSIPDDALSDIKKGKVRITTMIDCSVYSRLKSMVKKNEIGYQTLMNNILKNAMEEEELKLSGFIKNLLEREIKKELKPALNNFFNLNSADKLVSKPRKKARNDKTKKRA